MPYTQPIGKRQNMSVLLWVRKAAILLSNGTSPSGLPVLDKYLTSLGLGRRNAMAVKPISPKEVVNNKAGIIPDAIFEAFNELIAKKWDGTRSVIEQDEVIDVAIAKMMGDREGEDYSTFRQRIFLEHWFDVEDIYRRAGWIVEYDKSSYDDTSASTFIFKKKRVRGSLREYLGG